MTLQLERMMIMKKISTLKDYDLGIDIEGELLRILSSLPEEEGEQNDHTWALMFTFNLV